MDGKFSERCQGCDATLPPEQETCTNSEAARPSPELPQNAGQTADYAAPPSAQQASAIADFRGTPAKRKHTKRIRFFAVPAAVMLLLVGGVGGFFAYHFITLQSEIKAVTALIARTAYEDAYNECSRFLETENNPEIKSLLGEAKSALFEEVYALEGNGDLPGAYHRCRDIFRNISDIGFLNYQNDLTPRLKDEYLSTVLNFCNAVSDAHKQISDIMVDTLDRMYDAERLGNSVPDEIQAAKSATASSLTTAGEQKGVIDESYRKLLGYSGVEIGCSDVHKEIPAVYTAFHAAYAASLNPPGSYNSYYEVCDQAENTLIGAYNKLIASYNKVTSGVDSD